MKTVSTAQMKSIDEKAIHEFGIPSLELMEYAAAHVAKAVSEMVQRIQSPRVVLICGTGNNGGDGLACARLLMQQHIAVTVFLVGNPAKRTADAAVNSEKLEALGCPIQLYTGESLPESDCIVDALFGFGLNREVTGLYRQAIDAMNCSPAPVIACDIPSGLNGDTGLPMGTAVKASKTITFSCAKVGLVLPHAAHYVGALTVADIGIPEVLLP